MAALTDTAVRPPRGGRTARSPVRIATAIALAVLAAVLAAPAANAAGAQQPASADGRVVLADPAPSPSPQSSDPGIGLGPGAPTNAPTAPTPVTTSDPTTGGGSDPSWYDIPGQINKAINDWFASMVTSALTPMLNLLGATLLGTPDVTVMSGVTRIWTQMALLANALYILLVLAGAVIVTTHGTVQSRFSAKEVIPRLAVGMIAGNASLGLIALMIRLANAVAGAILGSTVSPASAGAALGHQLSTEAVGGGGIFLVLLLLGGVVMLAAILLTYIVRVALTVVLAVSAPLALSMHAVPGADGFARMWWRAMTGCLLIQLGQTLAFIVALQVMLDPNANVSLLGLPNNNAWVDPLVFIAVCWILIKIPFWVSRTMMGGGGSRIWSMAKAVIAYKTLGVLGMQKGPGGLPIRRRPGGGPNRPRASAPRGPGPGGTGPKPAPSSTGWGTAAASPTSTPAARRRRTGAGVRSAAVGQGPRLAVEAVPSPSPSRECAPERPPSGPTRHQMPIPIPDGGRKQLEARATARDARLARNAMSRPEQPGTWLEEREAQRRVARNAAAVRESPAAGAGPRFRQEGLFPRSPTRMNPPPPPTTPSRSAAAGPPGPAVTAAGTPAPPPARRPTPAVGGVTGTMPGPATAASPAPGRIGTPRAVPARQAPTPTPAVSPAARTTPSAAPRPAPLSSSRTVPRPARNSTT
ncbi:hypothetical protein [Actinospica robiniae]|uniref:hypothetical protein n=1 Tax=Actinospica robiniae TaxID=304901 RepID=UPI0004244FE9|nr:hypothetical protein [Actinospica robiniae]